MSKYFIWTTVTRWDGFSNPRAVLTQMTGMYELRHKSIICPTISGLLEGRRRKEKLSSVWNHWDNGTNLWIVCTLWFLDLKPWCAQTFNYYHLLKVLLNLKGITFRKSFFFQFLQWIYFSFFFFTNKQKLVVLITGQILIVFMIWDNKNCCREVSLDSLKKKVNPSFRAFLLSFFWD